MVETQLGVVLRDLEPFFKCHLVPDNNNSCLIKMGKGLRVQIELDRAGFLLIGCRLGQVHMGNYRNSLIRAALQSNEFTPATTGVLGFSHKSNQLILFLRINLDEVMMHHVLDLLPPFIEKARSWCEAIAAGSVPIIATETASPGLFGLIK